MKQGRVTRKKGTKSGCYDVCIAGVPQYNNVRGVVEAKIKQKQLKKKQGKKFVKERVKKLLKN